ncbi:MAG TPA: hypothetical protein VMH37_17550, partial [Candidatus Binataceae bacterium]|nr:hypothetical protein [Candidatus Binataceae bacterium]
AKLLAFLMPRSWRRNDRMLSKLVIVLALASLAAVTLELLGESENGAVLEQEVAGQLDALREHLFRR